MKVSELVEKLKECDQDAEVALYLGEEECGDIASSVVTDKHPSEFYYKGDCYVDKDTKAVTITN